MNKDSVTSHLTSWSVERNIPYSILYQPNNVTVVSWKSDNFYADAEIEDDAITFTLFNTFQIFTINFDDDFWADVNDVLAEIEIRIKQK